MPKDKCVVSKRAMVARSEGRRERAITAEPTRIDARENRCLPGLLSARIPEGTTVTAASVGTRIVTLMLGSMWEKP